MEGPTIAVSEADFESLEQEVDVCRRFRTPVSLTSHIKTLHFDDFSAKQRLSSAFENVPFKS